MRLALSTTALPGRSPADVARACGPRGLAGIEISVEEVPAVDEARAWRELSAPVVALRAETLAVAASPELARIAGLLEAPVVTPPGLLSPDGVAALAPAYATQGATLLLGARTRLDEVRRAAELVERHGGGALGIAWEIRPLEDELACTGELLRLADPHLLHVRLHGGGPEQKQHDGRGIGDVFVQLALARYAGAVALAPTDASQHALWERWAEGSRPAGCGSADTSARPIAGRLELDVRSVEPKDRIETVLGSYAGVAPGGTLHLVVDHDPECMNHLLTATQPPASFRFEYRERGPEVWRVDVVRRA